MPAAAHDAAGAAPHLDTPLTSTLRFDALHARPGRRRIRQLRRAAVSGRYGDGWRTTVERGFPSPATPALVVGGLATLFPVLGMVAPLGEGDLDGAVTALMLAVLAFLLFGSIAWSITAAARRRQWRHHAVLARFAQDNGLPYRLMADGESLPPIVGRSRRGGRPRHTDVVEARVRGRELLAGRRRTRVEEGHRRSVVRLVWVAVRLPDAAQARQAADFFRVQQWRREHAHLGEVEARSHEDWVLLGVESQAGDPAALAALVTGIDDVLSTADDVAHGGVAAW